MKNYLLPFTFLVFSFSVISAQAPSYKNFEWDVIKLGYSLPGSDSYAQGGIWGGELRLNLRDDLSIGLRTEAVSFGNDFGDTFDVDISWSWAVTSDYYFNTTSAYRAFAGLGFGGFKSGNIKEVNDDVIVTEFPGTSSAGLIPRVGYEFNHLRLSAEYNFTFKEAAPNYLAFSAALTLWGGYKGDK